MTIDFDIPSPDQLAWHWVGGLLVGAYDCPGSVPDAVADERLRRIVEAIIAVAWVDQAWPVDVGRVAATLHEMGTYRDIGGHPLLIDLVETWSERVTRARELGEIEAACRIALATLADEQSAAEAALTAADTYRAARARAAAAMAALDAARDAA